MKKSVITEIIRGTTYTFDSPEELWFAWWLEELLERGVVESWGYQAKTWPLTSECVLCWQEQGARKVLDRHCQLFRPHTYTADFSVLWKDERCIERTYPSELSGVWTLRQSGAFFGPRNSKAIMLCANSNMPVCHVDIKGAFVRMKAQEAVFSLARGVVWERHHDYVNKIIPHSTSRKTPACLFRDTFVPRRFLFTDKTAKMRTIPYPTRTVDEWLKTLEG